MQKFIVNGGKRLRGELVLQGSKNSALPIMAAALLCSDECVLKNCPKLSDIYASARILNYMGCKCSLEGNTAVISPGQQLVRCDIPEELMQEMRSSIIFLGAVLGRTGECTVCYPGGCELGPRPIDMHLAALRKMGADIHEDSGRIICRLTEGVHGARISLPFPSVGATENIVLCAVAADGETVINNAAREPEICDLCSFLRACGADISGDGGSSIVIHGGRKLHGCEYSIMPDRIAGASYLCMTAAAKGEIILTNACVPAMEPFLSVLEQTGCSIYAADDRIYLRSGSRLRAVRERIRTMPHPGFPTDAQALLMAALAAADGTSVFEENIFDCRYRHTDALTKMGADIQVMGKVAVVKGVERLHGANVEATDLRGGAAMVTAALAAEGRTEINGISHIDRGYEKLEDAVSRLGGMIRRV